MTEIEQQLVDFSGAPEIYCDGIAKIYLTGAMARLVLFSWQLIGGVFRPVRVATVIRPAASLAGLDQATQLAKRIELDGVPETVH